MADDEIHADKSPRAMTRNDLEEEVARLRQIADFRPSDVTEDGPVWLNVGEDFRDRMAARALIQAQGNPLAALRSMGIDTEFDPETKRTSQGLSIQKLQVIGKKLFERDTVRAFIASHSGKAEAKKDAIVSRLVEIAMHGEPADAIRATTVIAKLFGWMAPTKMQVQSQSASVSAIISDPAKMAELLSMFNHEPGAAALMADAIPEKQAIPRVIEHDE